MSADAAINLRHLRAFVAVAREQSFTRAAERLFLSQSALTIAVRQLEAHLGVTLLHRTTRSVGLTEDGAAFLPAAERLLADFDAAIGAVRQRAAQRRGRVAIAVLPSVATRLLPPIVTQFHAANPDIRLMVRDDNGRGVQRQLLEHDVDFGISNVWKPHPELEFTPLSRDRFGLVCRRDDPLAEGDGPLPWSAIDPERLFVMAADTGVHTALQESPGFAERFPTPAGEVLAMVTLLEMLRAGLGVTVLPELARPSDSDPDLVFRRLVNPVVFRHLGLIRRRHEALAPGARRAWDFIRARAPREIAPAPAPDNGAEADRDAD
ncbi:MAG: LysR family transcriptional regulator [Roseovarius sp.]